MGLKDLSADVRQYLLITANYWGFTLTDGALRMLVVLYFHQLGYSPLNIAMLFLFYEIFGVVTNLVGGWLGARLGLNRTMNIGLGLQVLALGMLTVPNELLTVVYVMAAQALSGIAKDLNKMSAKSAIKFLVADNEQSQLYKWIALLTGSKNALKGVGFFLGGLLLSLFEFQGAIWIMLVMLALMWLLSVCKLTQDLGKAKNKPKFSELFSKSRAINYLSAARMCLFGARDVWFVVALPVFLTSQFNWSSAWVGGFMASWVIGYGLVQTLAPKITAKAQGHLPTGRTALVWASYLSVIPALIALALGADFHVEYALIIGLLIFGAVFAVNSSLHSYLIVSFADKQGVSLDVGFYYMANAMGRLIGTVLSGWVYQAYGLAACLWISSIFIVLAAWLSRNIEV
ncbi:organoarsenical effux MFS transporter ArsJ [Shewanella sp. SR44-3]|uniref:organoarsenical effux MFS transporter ArsJ n=1 Tax=unclassified Shewanella TaxID=196818 RepID=UPI0015FDBA81|nr:organoarsenical effux MFS transporter ArsJ [Shewanella sp. SR44-3]MBB1268835.1 organoarsenical effux MFS transporter ArsJ [Shewanella sp. SR44-3]